MKALSLKRVLFLFLGLLCVGTGLIGAVLPLLPTTPFMILAVFCFARSSQRLHDWLHNHRIFGPSIQKWEQHNVIPPAAKVMSLSAMSLSLGYAALNPSISWLAFAIMASICGYGAWYVLTKPSHVPSLQTIQAPSSEGA